MIHARVQRSKGEFLINTEWYLSKVVYSIYPVTRNSNSKPRNTGRRANAGFQEGCLRFIKLNLKRGDNQQGKMSKF